VFGHFHGEASSLGQIVVVRATRIAPDEAGSRVEALPADECAAQDMSAFAKQWAT
jgi:hypothetical protein